MNILNLAIVLIVIITYLILRQRMIIYIPLIEALRLLLVWHSKLINTEWVFVVVYSLVIFEIIIRNNNRLRNNLKIFFTPALMFIFILFLGLFRTTDILNSLEHVWKYTIILLVFPSSILYFYNNTHDVKKYIKVAYYSVGLVLLSIIFFNIFKIGHIRGYLGTGFIYLGWIQLNELYMLIYLGLFTTFLSLNNTIGNDGLNDSSNLTGILWAAFVYLFFISLVFIGKREYIYLVVLSTVIYIVVKNKFNLSKYVIILSVFFLLLALFYVSGFDRMLNNSTFVQRLNEREITEEGRYLEYLDYVTEFKYNDIKFILFGKEIFNSRGKFFQTSRILFDRDRILHSDITHFLYGVGITGLLIFFFLLYRVFVLGYKIYKINRYEHEVHLYWAIFITIYLLSFAHNFSGGLFSINNKIIQWQMMGVILSVILNKSIINKNSPINT